MVHEHEDMSRNTMSFAIPQMPGIESPAVGELIAIDGLRRTGVDGFPCGWLYLDRGDHLARYGSG